MSSTVAIPHTVYYLVSSPKRIKHHTLFPYLQDLETNHLILDYQYFQTVRQKHTKYQQMLLDDLQLTQENISDNTAFDLNGRYHL